MFGSGLRGEKTVEGVWIGGGGVAVIQQTFCLLFPVRVFETDLEINKVLDTR